MHSLLHIPNHELEFISTYFHISITFPCYFVRGVFNGKIICLENKIAENFSMVIQKRYILEG